MVVFLHAQMDIGVLKVLSLLYQIMGYSTHHNCAEMRLSVRMKWTLQKEFLLIILVLLTNMEIILVQEVIFVKME